MKISLSMAACVALVLAAVPAGAQGPDGEFVEAVGNVVPVPLPPGGPSPRMADGHVDLSGAWFPGPTGKANAWSVVPNERVVEDPIPFQPWAQERRDSMSRVEIELNGNANVQCLPPGTPGMFTENPYLPMIVMKPDLFVHLIENNNRWRLVRIGVPHKVAEELEPLYNGDMIGYWEEDTFIIDSISIKEETWIRDGWFHSDELHVIERLRRPSYNYLEYQFTIEDPQVLTEPWTSAWRTYSLANEDPTENFCERNENVEQFRRLLEIQDSQTP
jgi:hypothetical protein